MLCAGNKSVERPEKNTSQRKVLSVTRVEEFSVEDKLAENFYFDVGGIAESLTKTLRDGGMGDDIRHGTILRTLSSRSSLTSTHRDSKLM